MSKHTPGPWVRSGNNIKSRTDNCVVIRIPAQTARYGAEWEIERRDADAHLIAAAPELLEALEEIVKEYCENPDNGRTLRWAVDGAKEAIAKAKREE